MYFSEQFGNSICQLWRERYNTMQQRSCQRKGPYDYQMEICKYCYYVCWITHQFPSTQFITNSHHWSNATCRTAYKQYDVLKTLQRSTCTWPICGCHETALLNMAVFIRTKGTYWKSLRIKMQKLQRTWTTRPESVWKMTSVSSSQKWLWTIRESSPAWSHLLTFWNTRFNWLFIVSVGLHSKT